MPRPKRPRHIVSRPAISGFKPEGEDAKGEVSLSFEEFEAVRLIDYEGMDQSGAAQIMNVSRQTVGRILRAGRFKLTKALVEAHRLKVEGGCYKIHENGYGRGRHGHGYKGKSFQGHGRRCGRKGAGPEPGQGRLRRPK